MTLDMQKHSIIHVQTYDLKKIFFHKHTLEMNCTCLMISQVPLDNTCAFGSKFGAEWTPMDR